MTRWWRSTDPERLPWPVRLTSADGRDPQIVLRPLRVADRPEWEQLRAANREHVLRWDPTSPTGPAQPVSFRRYVNYLDRGARQGQTQPFLVEVGGAMVGQMQLFNLNYGSLRSAAAGYWIARSVGGRGLATRALAMVCDHAFDTLGLHRVEVNIRPENAPSLRVVEHLGFREEGQRLHYLHINGAWRDHRSFALTVEDLEGRPVRERWAGSERSGR